MESKNLKVDVSTALNMTGIIGHSGTSECEVIESLKNGLNCFSEEILSLALQDDKERALKDTVRSFDKLKMTK